MVPFLLIFQIISNYLPSGVPARHTRLGHRTGHLLVEQLLHLRKHALQLQYGGLVVYHPASLDTCGNVTNQNWKTRYAKNIYQD